MPAGVEVDITDISVIKALNTPGGAVFEWRDDSAVAIVRRATFTSPVNDPFNATHRNWVIGTYIAAWGFDRKGSNGHQVRATIYNGAPHADLVEFGRSPSFRRERFGWTEHTPPGSIRTHLGGTYGWSGHHTLRNAVNAVGTTTGDWSPVL